MGSNGPPSADARSILPRTSRRSSQIYNFFNMHKIKRLAAQPVGQRSERERSPRDGAVNRATDSGARWSASRAGRRLPAVQRTRSGRRSRSRELSSVRARSAMSSARTEGRKRSMRQASRTARGRNRPAPARGGGRGNGGRLFTAAPDPDRDRERRAGGNRDEPGHRQSDGSPNHRIAAARGPGHTGRRSVPRASRH